MRSRRVGGPGWAGVHGSFVGLGKGKSRRSGKKRPKLKRKVKGFSGHLTLEEARHAGLTLQQWREQATSHVRRLETKIQTLRSEMDHARKELLLAEKARQNAFRGLKSSRKSSETVHSLQDIIDNATAERECTRWNCTTCGAHPFRTRLLNLVDATTDLSEESAEKLAVLANSLTDMHNEAAIDYVLRMVSTTLGSNRTIKLLSDTPAGRHFQTMLRARQNANERREEHRRRNDPEFVAAERARKAAEKAERHAERLAAKRERDKAWREARPNESDPESQ